MAKRIAVIHDMGAKNHYAAFSTSPKYDVSWYEVSVGKLVVKSIIKRDISLFLKQFVNIFHLFTLYSFVTADRVVLGLAPYDWRLILFFPLMRRCKVIYHTSWPHWSADDVPKRFFVPFFRRVWGRGLKKIAGAACVSKMACEQLASFVGSSFCGSHLVKHSINRVFFNDIATWNDREFDFVYVGRLVDAKGVPEILSLAKQFPSYKFLLIGENRGGYSFEEFSNIRFVSYIFDQIDLVGYLDRSKFFLLPSKKVKGWEELYGISLIESLARGCIPIVSDNVGPREIVSELGYGSILNSENFLAECVELLSNRDVPLGDDSISELVAQNASQYSAGCRLIVWDRLFGQ